MKTKFYTVYASIISFLLSFLLFLFRWKRETILLNAEKCGFSPSFSFLFWLYFNICRDFVGFLHRIHAHPIFLSGKDQSKLERLKVRGSILVSAHFHNWEAMGGWLVHDGVKLLTSERPFNNQWARTFLARLRKSHGILTISKNVPRLALRHIRSGACFAVIWDQYSPVAREWAPFFKIPVAMDPLPAFLAKHSQAPIFMSALLPNGRLRLFQLQAAQSAPVDGSRLAKKYHRILERLIRANPSYWYGFTHARFKDVFQYGNNRRAFPATQYDSEGSNPMKPDCIDAEPCPQPEKFQREIFNFLP
jgi:hypothetical protein